MSTLHLMALEKFIPSFILFVRDSFFESDQFFITYGDDKKYPYEINTDSVHIDLDSSRLKRVFSRFWHVQKRINNYEKVVVHGLFDPVFIFLLWLNPWVLRKSYWIAWGGDLYGTHRSDGGWWSRLLCRMRRSIIRRIGFIVTGTPGDYELARKWYGAQGKHILCFNYPSNLFKSVELPSLDCPEGDLVVQVGNSGDPTNNHAEAFSYLLNSNVKVEKVYCPLAYGDKSYIAETIYLGEKLFGSQFEPQTEMVPSKTYYEKLAQIDIGIFAHNRQQALGNIITLLGLGKTVFIKEKNTLGPMLESYGIRVRYIGKDEVFLNSKVESERNIQSIKQYFSEESLVESLSRWII